MSHQQRAYGHPRRSEVRVVVDSVKDYAIFQLDVDGTILTWNAGARAIKGYLDEEVIGTSFTRFYTPEDQALGKPWRMLREAASRGRYEDEGWRVRADGSRFWADVVVSAVRDDEGQLTGFVKVTRDLSERRAAEEATRKRVRQNAATAEIGLKALEARSVRHLFVQTAAAVASVLDVDVVGVFELTRDHEDAMVLRAGLGWPDGIVGTARVPLEHASETGPRIPVLFNDLAEPASTFAAPLLREAQVVSGAVVPILGSVEGGRVYGALAVGSRHSQRIDDDDMHFLVAVATMLAAATSRAQVSRALRAAEHETEEERVARERAEQALHERDEFISIAAHELRTPITSLQLKLQTLERALISATDGSEKLQPRVSGALRQVARLSDLVERLLDVTRLSSERVKLGFAEVEVARLVRDVVDDFREQARATGSSLEVRADTAAHACWDQHRMVQALANLISNALKYGAGAPVEVRAFDDGDTCVIEVEDRGIGVSAQDAERIFARFERAVSSRHYGGLGLGLYITREIVEAHQGRASVRPAEPKGAVFRLEVPLRPDAGEASFAARAPQ